MDILFIEIMNRNPELQGIKFRGGKVNDLCLNEQHLPFDFFSLTFMVRPTRPISPMAQRIKRLRAMALRNNHAANTGRHRH